ncbi:hypothetical protein [Alienimonas californiensis]|uniref:Uncharacterized protein n=1 Tax=Alienimonas californiensis TaxID=2527989 RepID=A0A517P814_9PLAN|nr:hypothetical protein [Alienimonas californiensis]QDT15520.1 hypothetical protein CA12_16050 [Alienimonas californiensis]
MTLDDDAWTDPRTWIAVGGFTIGVAGFLFALLRDRWSRRESRLETLGKTLQPLIQAGQSILRAVEKRKRIEQLKHSYPTPRVNVLVGVEQERRFPERTPEVVARVNLLVEQYNDLNNQAEAKFREAESEFGSRHFRLPDRIVEQVRELKNTLSEAGRLLNDGLLNKCDLQLAEFGRQHEAISKTARGWRLAAPFEGYRRRVRRREEVPADRVGPYDLTRKEMDGVFELVAKLMMSDEQAWPFAVHPPQKVLAEPSILAEDDVVDRLSDDIFSIVLRDGTARLFSLPELMAFTFNLIDAQSQRIRASKMIEAVGPDVPIDLKITSTFSMDRIMSPEMVKVLLSKIEFSDTPSDG